MEPSKVSKLKQRYYCDGQFITNDCESITDNREYDFQLKLVDRSRNLKIVLLESTFDLEEYYEVYYGKYYRFDIPEDTGNTSVSLDNKRLTTYYKAVSARYDNGGAPYSDGTWTDLIYHVFVFADGSHQILTCSGYRETKVYNKWAEQDELHMDLFEIPLSVFEPAERRFDIVGFEDGHLLIAAEWENFGTRYDRYMLRENLRPDDPIQVSYIRCYDEYDSLTPRLFVN